MEGVDCCDSRDELTGFAFVVKTDQHFLLISGENVSDGELRKVRGLSERQKRGKGWEFLSQGLVLFKYSLLFDYSYRFKCRMVCDNQRFVVSGGVLHA